jgi:hypothetical protein
MFDNFLSQLRNTPRLRWGILLIVGIAWFYSVLLLRDSLQDHIQQQRNSAQAIARLRAQLSQPEWVARVLPAKVIAVQMETRLWQAATSGLAQAAFQDWLKATLAKAGVSNPQISVTMIDEAIPNPASPSPDGIAGTPAIAVSDLWRVKAKVSFELNAATLMDLLNRIETHDKQTVLELLNVRKEPSSRVDMELYGYFQKPAAASIRPAQEPGPL